MSNSSKHSSIDQIANGETPKGIIHKQILSVAADQPDASPMKIAARVSGASIQMVERVLDEHGDSAPDPSAAHATNSASNRPELGSDSSLTAVNPPSLSELTTKQQQTLHRIYEQPGATQSDLAEAFEVDRTSISHRLNNVDGFEWDRRHEFVERLFEDEAESTEEPEADSPRSETTPADDMDTETAATPQHDDSAAPRANGTAGDSTPDSDTDLERSDTLTIELDSSLAHKVLHACLDSEHISTNEELELLQDLLSTSSETTSEAP